MHKRALTRMLHPRFVLFLVVVLLACSRVRAASWAARFHWNAEVEQRPLLEIPDESVIALSELSKLRYPVATGSFGVFETLRRKPESGSYVFGSPEIFDEFFELVRSDKTGVYKAEGIAELIDGEQTKSVTTVNGDRYLFVRYPDNEFRCAFARMASGRVLSFTYTTNGLLLHSVSDNRGRFVDFEYQSGRLIGLSQTWMEGGKGITRRWTVTDGSKEKDEVRFSHAVVRKSVPANAVVREYSPESEASDRLLASIFGGPGSVAAGNGFEPLGLIGAYSYYRGDVIGDDGLMRMGHLSSTMHLYGSADGTGQCAVYVPKGFVAHSAAPSPKDSVITFYYPRLGNFNDVTVAVFHVAEFALVEEGERVRIGKIGGPGGSSQFYVHSHVEFYRGNVGLPEPEVRSNLRIRPASVFGFKVGD